MKEEQQCHSLTACVTEHIFEGQKAALPPLKGVQFKPREVLDVIESVAPSPLISPFTHSQIVDPNCLHIILYSEVVTNICLCKV